MNHVLSEGFVRTRYNGASVCNLFQPLNKQQLMDLQSAKKDAAAKSKADKKKTYYLNVDDEGEVSIATEYDADASGMAYKGGVEIALPAPEKSTKVTETKNKKTAAADSAQTMSTKKSTKTAVKKETPKIEGAKKDLSITQIIALQKKGVKCYRQKEPHYILIPERMRDMKNKEKVLKVIVSKTV